MPQPKSKTPSARVPAALKELEQYRAERCQAQTDRRRRPRVRLEAPCVVSVLLEDGENLAELPGRTRNISNRGLGIRLKRCLHVDEPVEVRLDVRGRDALYLAGVVRHCRRVANGSFEVGVEFIKAGNAPIFTEHPRRAIRELPWLADALKRRGAPGR